MLLRICASRLPPALAGAGRLIPCSGKPPSAAISLWVLCGCTVGPNYQRPKLATPAQFRAPEPLPPAASRFHRRSRNGLRVFKDEQLQELIRTALVTKLRSSRCGCAGGRGARQSGDHAVRSISQFGASGGVEINRLSRDGATPIPAVLCPRRIATSDSARCNLLSFEIDIWGRLRRATEAARANLLSAEENRKAVVTTLVSDVATAYLSLRELDYELEISQRTLRDARRNRSI